MRYWMMEDDGEIAPKVRKEPLLTPQTFVDLGVLRGASLGEGLTLAGIAKGR